MINEILLEKISTDDSNRVVKIYNKQLLTPLTFNAQKEILELDCSRLINIPILNDEGLKSSDLDLLLVELLKKSKRTVEFDVFNTDVRNLKNFIKKATREFREYVSLKTQKIAVLSKSKNKLETPLRQLLKLFEYVEFIEHPAFNNQVLIVPLDIKCGSLITLKSNKNKYGMVVYEEYIKKLIIHTNNDLNVILSQIIKELDTGEI